MLSVSYFIYSFFYCQAIENCVSTAGYSVGEYSALVFAGAMSFEDGIYAIYKHIMIIFKKFIALLFLPVGSNKFQL